MDKAKQPGIIFDSIILVKESFWREFNVPDNSEVLLDIDMKLNIQEPNSTTQLDTTVLMKYDGKNVLELKTTFVGIFSIKTGEENMNMEQYLKIHSPALMFPFIREHIATITQKSGVGPILLPPVNLIALINQKNIKV